jgi:hypothetical protein
MKVRPKKIIDSNFELLDIADLVTVCGPGSYVEEVPGDRVFCSDWDGSGYARCRSTWFRFPPTTVTFDRTPRPRRRKAKVSLSTQKDNDTLMCLPVQEF